MSSAEPLERLRVYLLSQNLRPRAEVDLQDTVALGLRFLGIEHERELPMGPGCRPDFFLPQTGWALEVKLRFPRGPTLRQIARYLEQDRILGVALICQRPVSFPLGGHAKPVLELPVWKAMFV